MALAARNPVTVSHRSRENLLLIIPLLALVLFRLATVPPVMGWARIPLNTLGVGLLLGGLALRVVARQWKAERAHGGLVMDGPYAYLRHPLYAGSFLLGLGLSLIVGDWLLTLAFLVLFTLSHATVVRNEERDLEATFGASYVRYRAEVPAFIPALSLPKQRLLPRRLKEALVRECDSLFLWLALPLVLQLVVWGFHGAPHDLLPVTLSLVLAALTLVWVPVKREYRAMLRRERGYASSPVSLRRQNR